MQIDVVGGFFGWWYIILNEVFFLFFISTPRARLSRCCTIFVYIVGIPVFLYVYVYNTCILYLELFFFFCSLFSTYLLQKKKKKVKRYHSRLCKNPPLWYFSVSNFILFDKWLVYGQNYRNWKKMWLACNQTIIFPILLFYLGSAYVKKNCLMTK